MGRRGPARAPDAAKLRRGETRPSRLNGLEPLPRHRPPSMPKGLDPVARAAWRHAVRELGSSGLITAADATSCGCTARPGRGIGRPPTCWVTQHPSSTTAATSRRTRSTRSSATTPTTCACSPVSWASRPRRGRACSSCPARTCLTSTPSSVPLHASGWRVMAERCQLGFRALDVDDGRARSDAHEGQLARLFGRRPLPVDDTAGHVREVAEGRGELHRRRSSAQQPRQAVARGGPKG